MSAYFTGDELGNIKLVSGSRSDDPESTSSSWKFDDRILHSSVESNGKPENLKPHAIDRIVCRNVSGSLNLAAANHSGTIKYFSFESADSKLNLVNEWKESRFKAGHSFVGLDSTPDNVLWCTSNGALGLVQSTNSGDEESKIYKSALPMRLCDWKLSSDADVFAYGGNEVDLSIWNTEKAFSTSQQDSIAKGQKRKRIDGLFPAEIWRAKNLPNDSLNLRQPIHITSLSFISRQQSKSSTHLVTGTQLGDVRRYDTRAGLRPVDNWTGIAKTGGVGVVQAGSHEHEIFVSDRGNTLSALDLRNGKIIYSYKGIQGAITSISSPQDSFMATTSRDRFLRLHSAPPPPSSAGQQQDDRGEILGTLYTKSVATCIVFAQMNGGDSTAPENTEEGDGDEEEVWTGMRDADESDNETDAKRNKRRR